MNEQARISQDILREGFTSLEQLVQWEQARKIVLWELVRLFGIVRQAEKDRKP